MLRCKKKYKSIATMIMIIALLFSSAISLPITVLADDWGGGGGSDNDKIRFDDNSKCIDLVTSVVSGSTAPNRIRSIGWLVTIYMKDGRQASAVFEKNGDDGTYMGYSAYSFSYDYIVNEFRMDAGSTGESVARDFLYGTGTNSGGTIKMWAYFTWWRENNSPNSQFNVGGASDGVPGAVSGAFIGDTVDAPNAAINYTPADVNNMFVKNPDSRFNGLHIPNGVAANLSDASVIPTMWGGTMDLSDYYPATGVRPPLQEPQNDLSITLQDMGIFRGNTEVIESAIITNTGKADVTPSDNVPVHFVIPGVTDQTKYVCLPYDSSQLVYFKFRTPAQPGNITMTATVNSNHAILETDYNNDMSSKTVYVNAFNEATPPDPKATDRAGPYFQYINPSAISGTYSTSWGLWEWVNNSFQYQSFSASVTSKLTVAPDSRVPTAFKRSDDLWQIKSGYGINEKVTTQVSTSSSDPDAITGVQRTISYFPEFEYNDTSYDNSGYFRIMEMLSGGNSASFDLQVNPYSRFGSHAHFLPIWFADNRLYTPETYSFDVWTPKGMLSISSTDSVYINGSLFDDFQTGPDK
jgi:hypothetical protein